MRDIHLALLFTAFFTATIILSAAAAALLTLGGI